ncbi:ornithine carbamoyltransferase [Oceanobacillus manasiensis]|uniref:ornithine carbamoyltransferase n=1 Tax=Oceanobacillus manasiensis TaxID=586413 RepID=UPI0005A885C3|nr:ornithine carbamoyltransferase [Oceanobacillus manasiensis]
MTIQLKEAPNSLKSLAGRDFLTLENFKKEEILSLLDLAEQLKAKRKAGEEEHTLKGKTLGMIFEKASTRTRVSFEAGIYQLGGNGIFLSTKDLQIGRGEPIADTAKVLSGYLDGIMIRTYSQEMVEELAANASIPVINGLTDLYHPCQVLADLLTIKEQKGALNGINITYIGDGNNMANSLMIGAGLMGMNLTVCAPVGYAPSEAIVTKAKQHASISGGKIIFETLPNEAVRNADVVYTDVWASMGQEEEQKQRIEAFQHYQVTAELFALAKPDATFMHCLPAHRGEEVESAVIDGEQSVVFEQAENRLHAQKALMTELMG